MCCYSRLLMVRGGAGGCSMLLQPLTSDVWWGREQGGAACCYSRLLMVRGGAGGRGVQCAATAAY